MTDPVIDLSHWQAAADFATMKSDGVVGVIHKATEDQGYVDDAYAARKTQAEAAGVLWGAYHFLRPGDMIAQAHHFVGTAGPIDLYAADHEDAGVSLSDLKTFLHEVEALTGTMALIYSGHVIKEQLGDARDDELALHRLWLAHYDDDPTWPDATWPAWWLWQYTDQGSIPGVTPPTDCNRYDGSTEALAVDWTGQQPPPPRPPRSWPIVQRIGLHARRSEK